MRMLLVKSMAVLALASAGAAPARADLLGDLKKIFEGKAIEISAVNKSKQTLYIYVDDTGRHGDKVKVDSAKAMNGKDNLPPGRVFAPGQDRTFGECVGGTDVPTIHVFVLNAKGVAVAEKASKKFGPDDYGKKVIEGKRPVIRLEITDTDITAK